MRPPKINFCRNFVWFFFPDLLPEFPLVILLDDTVFFWNFSSLDFFFSFPGFQPKSLLGFLPEFLAEFVPKILPGFLRETSRDIFQSSSRELSKRFSVVFFLSSPSTFCSMFFPDFFFRISGIFRVDFSSFLLEFFL